MAKLFVIGILLIIFGIIVLSYGLMNKEVKTDSKTEDVKVKIFGLNVLDGKNQTTQTVESNKNIKAIIIGAIGIILGLIFILTKRDRGQVKYYPILIEEDESKGYPTQLQNRSKKSLKKNDDYSDYYLDTYQ